MLFRDSDPQKRLLKISIFVLIPLTIVMTVLYVFAMEQFMNLIARIGSHDVTATVPWYWVVLACLIVDWYRTRIMKTNESKILNDKLKEIKGNLTGEETKEDVIENVHNLIDTFLNSIFRRTCLRLLAYAIMIYIGTKYGYNF